ncbi:hypothetical protein BpHYR1_028250 [Brachionus plicatilis]|uniref:Uncharacterized protein n=1 Tax=Brachionus plicatilis TaxID=10195 RepID=A0A3M7R6W6_BRAPC|nr:hypothetical protein BpHYR1_028250 [Brachionus plicatilis]
MNKNRLSKQSLLCEFVQHKRWLNQEQKSKIKKIDRSNVDRTSSKFKIEDHLVFKKQEIFIRKNKAETRSEKCSLNIRDSINTSINYKVCRFSVDFEDQHECLFQMKFNTDIE